ncbi:F-box domain-containing protein [Stipitochalara longipes BDJ]|nr:F-box domain-containing protein [Stipitochalara longipes BDJ]
MASKAPIGLSNLPNEIILHILRLFPTRHLLPLAPLSKRIYALILALLHQRILALHSLPTQKVVLECYHPSAKLSTPYFFCDYLYTDPLSTPSLKELRNLYSHFRPTPPEGDRKVWRPRASGGWSWVPISDVLGAGEEEELVAQDVYLESHELFSQLQCVVNVVETGIRKDLFLNCVTVGEGLVRVWRGWLAQRAKCTGLVGQVKGEEMVEDGVEEEEKGLLWSDTEKHVGLRVRVIESQDERVPVLVSRDEDPNVGYTLQYEELVVRSTQLLLMMEDSLDREIGNSGKAVVIVS